MMRKAVVTGATGFIGTHLVSHLLGIGYRVTCPVRNPDKAKHLHHSNLVVIADDLLCPQQLAGPIGKAETVFHLAGTIQGVCDEEYFRGNLETTAQLLKVIAAHAPPSQKLIYLSSQAAAGPCAIPPGKSEYDDTPQPVSAYGKSKLAAEDLIRRQKPKSSVILRPAIVYGPGDKAMLQLFQYARRGIIPVAGFRRFPVNKIYIQDLISAIMLAEGKDAALGKTYFVHDGVAWDWQDICREAAGSVAKKAKVLPVLLGIIHLFCTMSGVYSRLTGKSTVLNPDKWLEIRQDGWLCNCNAIQNELDFQPQWQIRDGFNVTAKWYFDNGWLK